ncbi:helix-turn-helix transcriptional regulator [Ruegeria sp. WL0004]|uniref:Helix-turn-helix transcriptional regulator n=1 Tax=Ruegeria marisflavi TaxID=2984152 RepID=A0ABT2WWH1_9RHOB|nr:helix-turn-helix transcriptional regulator [Ruegeria sp. WL0004]MCU9840236.1 helix-turn-helix transcriptional regulator [Ruegeria sp. WL0004]
MSISYRSSTMENQKSISRFFEIVSVFCQASQGSIPLIEALRRTGKTLDAEVTSICRVDFQTPARPVKSISHELHGYGINWAKSSGVSFSKSICGSFIENINIGCIITAGPSDLEDEPVLSDFYQQRRLMETIMIPLDRKNGVIDILELSFRFPIPKAGLEHLELIGPVLAGCWAGRSLGLFSDALLSRSRVVRSQQKPSDILSAENPFKLSRAEYRVCLLLSRGLNNKAVLSELSITMATLRTHLGNIYAKTGAASQFELVHLLLASPTTRNVYRIGTPDVA